VLEVELQEIALLTVVAVEELEVIENLQDVVILQVL